MSKRTRTKIPIITDWISYTPTITGAGTVSSNASYYRRVGDSLEVFGSFTSGTMAASAWYMSLPAGLSINSSKLSLSSNTESNPGNVVGSWGQNGSANQAGYMITSPGTSTARVYFGGLYTGTVSLSSRNANLTADNLAVAYRFIVPISGWTAHR